MVPGLDIFSPQSAGRNEVAVGGNVNKIVRDRDHKRWRNIKRKKNASKRKDLSNILQNKVKDISTNHHLGNRESTSHGQTIGTSWMRTQVCPSTCRDGEFSVAKEPHCL